MELTLTVEDDIYEPLADRAEDNGFASPEEYGETIIKTVIKELEAQDGDERGDVRKRLEDLGYL